MIKHSRKILIHLLERKNYSLHLVYFIADQLLAVLTEMMTNLSYNYHVI